MVSMDSNHAKDGIPEGQNDAERPIDVQRSMNPDELLEVERQKVGKALRLLLETPKGQEVVYRMLRDREAPEDLFELSEEERRVFESRWKDGFLRQVMLGEFDLEKALTSEEKAELLVSQDPQRRWLLETRRSLSRKKRK